jgi:hypothetical protein
LSASPDDFDFGGTSLQIPAGNHDVHFVIAQPRVRAVADASRANYGTLGEGCGNRVASKIPILLIRLGLKRLDFGLAIMGFEDASRP